jgi:serine protease
MRSCRNFGFSAFSYVFLLVSLCGQAALAQQTIAPDPFGLPTPRPASKGAYQWGNEMLRMEGAWRLTKGRAHLSIIDAGFANHPELQPGIDGNYRAHLSALDPAVTNREQANYFHGLMTMGVMAARGFNGTGITGACPWCSVSYYDFSIGDFDFDRSIAKAIASGASVMNISFGNAVDGTSVPDNCDSGGLKGSSYCAALRRAAERDMVVVAIAQNQANSGGAPSSDQIPFPANYPSVIAVGGLQSDGNFWTSGYESGNRGSNWGAKVRLVAPAKDVLTLTNKDKYLYDFKPLRCGDRVDATLGEERTLSEAYSGYGNCIGTSFAAPAVAGIAGLVRSANPLLTAPEVQAILYDTATRPVSGPVGSGLTFYIPDAEQAVQRALGSNAGNGVGNRVSPMFAMFAADAQNHLFSTSPQTAVAAIAGEFRSNSFKSVGNAVASYPRFSGKLCDAQGNNCAQPEARALFNIYTTENSPLAGRALVPLYRMTQVCAQGSAGCKNARTFAYATTRAEVQALEAKGYVIDVVEGFVFGLDGAQPANTDPLCLGVDSARIDYILYTNPSCTLTQLRANDGQTTGGNYQSTLIGYAPKLTQPLADFSDAWWAGASENGWGASIVQHGPTQFVVFYVYDAGGKPIWYVMPGGNWNADRTTYTGSLYFPASSPFDNYNAAAFSPNPPVGSATLTYGDFNSAQLSYTINGITGSKSIGRLNVRANNSPANLQVGDLWWGGDAQNGWGIHIAQQGGNLFSAWYTYDAAGKTAWYTVQGGGWNGNVFTGDVYATTGSPWLGVPYVASAVRANKVGTMTFNFANQNTATMTYTVNGITQSKSIVRQPF